MLLRSFQFEGVEFDVQFVHQIEVAAVAAVRSSTSLPLVKVGVLAPEFFFDLRVSGNG